MPFVTQKDGGLSTFCDIIVEIEAGIDDSSLKQILINNHIADNRSIFIGHLLMRIFYFGFCESFRKKN